MKQKIFLFFLLPLVFLSCTKRDSKYIYNEGFIYGTMYHIVYESPAGKDFQEAITQKLNEYNMIFSTWEEQSTISRINNNQPVTLDPLFVNCYRRSMEISRKTGGAFDITAGPLVNAWGFGPEERTSLTPERIDSLLEITGYQKITLKNGKIKKADPRMKLDMSAVAKGYTCDLIAGFLGERGCTNYMVEIGGEVVAKGKNEKGKIWTIGISKPDETAFFATGDLQAKVQLPEHALATSGNYRNFYEEDGKKYAHTIDPASGRPVQHSLLSATVLAKNCMDADAFATAFMVLGLEESKIIARENPDLMVYLIYADKEGNNQVYASESFREQLVD